MKIFLSHSKKDKELAHRIANDLTNNNISVWFDEWEIFVGDSIVKKIHEGLNSCDFLSIIFTRNSIDSNWVEREWHTMLYEEINLGKIKILPIKGDDCDLPLILKDKLFADFSNDYTCAMNKLIESINHFKKDYFQIDENSEVDKSNEIEIKFNNLDFDKFSSKDRDKIARAISEIIGISDVIKITNVRRGSVIVRLKFPNEKIMSNFFKKIEKYKNNEFVIEDAWLFEDKKSNVKTIITKEIISIEAAKNSPDIYINSITGQGYIKGNAILENASCFFHSILDWMNMNLVSSSLKSFEFNCHIKCFNSSALKYFGDILKIIMKMNDNGVNIIINWYYDEDDEDIYEMGEEYMALFNLPMKFIAVKN